LKAEVTLVAYVTVAAAPPDTTICPVMDGVRVKFHAGEVIVRLNGTVLVPPAPVAVIVAL
jgi:hypothetical protein